MTLPGRRIATVPFDIWEVDLDIPPEPAALAALDPKELDRAARFVFARDRDRYLAAHAALRQILSHHLDIAAHALRFESGAHGKPALAGACEGRLPFNLSHSDDVAWIALGPAGSPPLEIGVDVERLRSHDDADALARSLFSAREQAQWHRSPASARDRIFLTCWTRKEACLKALGSGLTIEPGSFDAGATESVEEVTIRTDAGPVVIDVASVPSGHGVVGAAAVLRPFVGRDGVSSQHAAAHFVATTPS